MKKKSDKNKYKVFFFKSLNSNVCRLDRNEIKFHEWKNDWWRKGMYEANNIDKEGKNSKVIMWPKIKERKRKSTLEEQKLEKNNGSITKKYINIL